MPRRPMMTYKVQMGDVVKFPNGVEVNYSEHPGMLVILPPAGNRLVLGRSSHEQALIGTEPE